MPGARANTMGNGIAERPGDPAKIEGDDPPAYLVYKSDPAYLQTIEPPKIRFVFRGSVVELPSSAKAAVALHWKEAIKYYYDDYFNKPKDGGEFEARENVWQRYSLETEKKFLGIYIGAPDGPRYLSAQEAKSLRNYIDLAAQRIIDKAKQPAQAPGPA
jgi:hypothetical protein